MTQHMASRVAGIIGALAVGFGAFGAHGLKELLNQNGTAAIWEKAVFYHFIHAVILFVLAQQPARKWFAWWTFLIGIVVFSGSLYALALTNLRVLGAITPIGGISFIAGWICLAVCPSATPNANRE